MKLKLLAPFRSAGFAIRSEIPVHDPTGYAAFWKSAEESIRRGNSLRFTHAPRYATRTSNRYQTIDTDSLIRPLHALELRLELGSEEGGLFPTTATLLEVTATGEPRAGSVRRTGP